MDMSGDKKTVKSKKVFFAAVSGIILLSFAVTGAVLFLTEKELPFTDSCYETGKCYYDDVLTAEKATKKDSRFFHITPGMEVYTGNAEKEGAFSGILVKCGMDIEKIPGETGADIDFGEITKAYTCALSDDLEYIFVVNAKGKVFFFTLYREACMSIFELERRGDCGEAFKQPESNVANARALKVLRERYPRFFGISADDGLTVYIWKMAENNYRCYLANTFLEAISDNSFCYKRGASLTEMRIILTSYNVRKDDICVTGIVNPLCEFVYEADDSFQQEVFEAFYSVTLSVPETPHGSALDLDSAIYSVLAEKYKTSYEGCVNIQSYYMFANDVNENIASADIIEEITVYTVVHEKDYFEGTVIPRDEGSFIPTVMTFSVDENGVYELVDYNNPREGELFESDVRELFIDPVEDMVLDKEKYADILTEISLERAKKYMNEN